MKSVVNRLLGRFGYEIRRDLFSARHLSELCDPGTVIDVGVGKGTFPLYEAYQHAYLILVEPLREHEAAINEILSRRAGEVHFKAAGSESGAVEICVDVTEPQLSSIFVRSETHGQSAVEKRRIDVEKLDNLLAGHDQLSQPIVLKIDTEGNELNVLMGATELLKSTEIVIAETSVAERFEGSYRFEDLIEFMRANGFCLHSILSIAHSRREAQPRYADLLFVRELRPES